MHGGLLDKRHVEGSDTGTLEHVDLIDLVIGVSVSVSSLHDLIRLGDGVGLHGVSLLTVIVV